MANYILTSNAKFNPFSFDELLKPALMATQAHLELEDKYSELSTKANIWEGMADLTRDKKAYAQYKNYANDLKLLADLLASLGLNINSRNSLNNMKSRYSSEIIPIEKAYADREAMIKELLDLYNKDDSIRFSNSAKTMSLDDFLGGNHPQYTRHSGKEAYTRAKEGAKAISSRYFNTVEGQAFNGAYDNLIRRQGLNPKQAMEVLEGSGEFPEFNLYRALMNKEFEDLSPIDRRYMNDKISEGFNAGIGYNETNLLFKRPEVSGGSGGKGDNGDLRIKGYTPNTGLLVTPKANEEFKMYSKFFNKDGSLNKKGLDAINYGVPYIDSMTPYNPMSPVKTETKLDYSFRDWVKNTLKVNSNSPEDIRKAYLEYSKETGDAQGTNTLRTLVGKSDSETLINLIKSNFEDEIPAFYSINWDTGETINKGTIDLSKLGGSDGHLIVKYQTVPIDKKGVGAKVIATLDNGKMFEVPLNMMGTNIAADFSNSNYNAIQDSKNKKDLEEKYSPLIRKAEALGYANLNKDEKQTLILVMGKIQLFDNNLKLNAMNTEQRLGNLTSEIDVKDRTVSPGMETITLR